MRGQRRALVIHRRTIVRLFGRILGRTGPCSGVVGPADKWSASSPAPATTPFSSPRRKVNTGPASGVTLVAGAPRPTQNWPVTAGRRVSIVPRITRCWEYPGFNRWACHPPQTIQARPWADPTSFRPEFHSCAERGIAKSLVKISLSITPPNCGPLRIRLLHSSEIRATP